MVMKCKNEKMGYVMPQTTIYTLVGECPILAGSPPVSTNPSVIPPTEDNEDTDLVPENWLRDVVYFNVKTNKLPTHEV